MPVDPPDDATLRRIDAALRARALRRRPRLVPPLRRGPARRRGTPSRSSTPPPRPAMPERAWSRPEPADNPFNAWYVTTSITGAGEGPLAGKTVAIKDNTAVAGVPDDERLGDDGGLHAAARRHRRLPLLAAGATIAGKSVCEDLCFSGGSHTSRPGRSATRGTRRARRAARRRAARRSSWPGIVDVATGGDQGGSVRIPSAYTGTVGHKPTLGPGALHRRVPDRADDRPRRPDHPHGRRRRRWC